MNSIGIGHNQGPPMGGLSTLPIAEKAIGGAVIKGIKTGLKNLNTMFESVGSGLKKSGLKKDERKEAAKAIQNEIDQVSKANNRKFRPKILRLETRPDQDNSFSNVVVAAVDDENGKIAAILDGKFFTKIDDRETLRTGSGGERKNKNFGKEINYLNVGGFFPIQSEWNFQIKEILESLNVPIYAKGEGVISPEDLAILNKRQSEGAMGHKSNKIEMGTKGTLGFTRSLQAGLPITDAAAGRISGSKGEGGQLDIRGAAIKDTATPIESLPDIDVSADLLEEMSDTGLKSLTPQQLQKITQRIVPSIGLPSNVKKIASLENRMENIVDRASARRDPYAARLLKEQDDLYDSQEVSRREPTIGELFSKETMIEKLQYGLLNKLSGDLSGKKGLLSLIKRGDDEMIVGSRSPDDPGELMITAEGERLVPRKQLFDPRVRKERVSDTPLGDIPDSSARRNITPETRENARRFQEYRDTRGRVLDDDSLGDNPEPPSNIGGSSSAVRSNLTNTDQIIDAYNEGIITEGEGWSRLTELINSGRISTEEGLDNATRFRQALGRGDGRLEEGSLGTYNDDGSINVELPDGTMTRTQLSSPDDLGPLLDQVMDGIVSEEEAMSIIEALETAMVINTEDAIRFQNHLDQLFSF
jgi:hypothetical protein|tara:strand:+ start:110 stop:2041 length:1932 start_codon:yes stop_codon:yes gene_type:complete